MIFDVLIRHGDVITENAIEPLDVAIMGNKVVALLARDSLDSDIAEAHQVIDATNLYVMPGAIDIHFHCRAPDRPDRGDFATETRAAAAGGVTTIFEMPISKPCCATPEIFRNRRAVGERDSYVNFGLYGAPGMLKREYVQGMADEGAIAYKIFTTAAPIGRNDEFEGLTLPNEEDQWQALKLVAETGLVCAIHAENNRLLEAFTAQLLAAGRTDFRTHNESRPPMVEALAVASLLTMNEQLQMNMHIAHLSSKATLEVFRRFKHEGNLATAETCPHYLVFTEDDLLRVGAFAKINPPLRHKADQEALWEGLRDGTLLAVTTDHSPFTYEEKARTAQDIWKAPPGAPGVEQLVLVVMDAALKGQIDLIKAAQLISTNGAKRFGLYPRKGTIRVGADADLCLYDPHQTTTIDPDQGHSKAKLCDRLYAGMTFQGRVIRTMVNGKTVFLNGEITGKAGDGQFVRPDAAKIVQGL